MAAGSREGRISLVEAMLFAAGLGTRLGAMTEHTPKALIPVAGVPVLQRVATRLVEAGVDRLIINTHHFSEQIVEFVQSRNGFGAEVVFSHEPGMPLETGGGLLAAAPLFRGDAPFFVHNADILSEVPLRGVYAQHLERVPLATLVVTDRETSRRLLFDEAGLLGRLDDRKGLRIEVRTARGAVREMAFAGIHVVSPAMLSRITEKGVFSILDTYLRLAADGYAIEPFHADGYRWIDIGKPEQLAEAERVVVCDGGFPLSAD